MFLLFPLLSHYPVTLWISVLKLDRASRITTGHKLLPTFVTRVPAFDNLDRLPPMLAWMFVFSSVPFLYTSSHPESQSSRLWIHRQPSKGMRRSWCHFPGSFFCSSWSTFSSSSSFGSRSRFHRLLRTSELWESHSQSALDPFLFFIPLPVTMLLT